MSSRLPVEVNPYRFIEQQRILIGGIAVSKLPRLKDILTSNDGDVAVRLEFIRSANNLPMIIGHLSVELSLVCQRCVQPMLHKVDTDVSLVLVTSDEQCVQLQEGYDTWLVEDEKVFLQDFIEDELMLALPLAAMHEQCEAARPFIEGLPSDETNEPAEGKKANPFAVLKDLK